MDLKLDEVKIQFEDLERTRTRKIQNQNDNNHSERPLQKMLVKDEDIKSIKSDIVLIKEELLEKDNDIRCIQDNAKTVINNLKGEWEFTFFKDTLFVCVDIFYFNYCHRIEKVYLFKMKYIYKEM